MFCALYSRLCEHNVKDGKCQNKCKQLNILKNEEF